MLGSAEASKIQANYQSGVVTVLEELPRRSMSVCTIWTTASLTSATLDRASTPSRPREEGGNFEQVGFYPILHFGLFWASPLNKCVFTPHDILPFFGPLPVPIDLPQP